MSKTRVIRVTPKEEIILEYLRKNSDGLLSELNLPFNIYNSKLIEFSRILRISEDKTLEDLIQQNFITEEEVYYIINEIIKNNRNLLIDGKVGVGKTVFLKSLINAQTDKKFLIFDELGEFNLFDKYSGDNITVVKEISLKTFTEIKDVSNTYFVINEVYNENHLLAISTAIQTGLSIIATVQSSNWIEILESSIKYKQYLVLLEKVLKPTEFFELHLNPPSTL